MTTADTAATEAEGAYIRGYYGVPAHIGTRITFDGQPAVIVGYDGERLLVVAEGETEPVPIHPTWRVDYHPDRSDAHDLADEIRTVQARAAAWARR